MFGKGKIDIAIQKSHYAPGDIVSGNVALTLKRPVKARELSISLIGEYKVAGDTRTSEPESNSPYVPHIVRGTSRWTKAAVYPGGRPAAKRSECCKERPHSRR